MRLAVFALVASLTTPAVASEAEAESCVRAKVWEAQREGWGVRVLSSTTLEPGATQSWTVTFYPGNTYQIDACADRQYRELDLYLYNLDGTVAYRDDATGREARLTLEPESTRTYYVVLHARGLADGATDAGAAVAVTYK